MTTTMTKRNPTDGAAQGRERSLLADLVICAYFAVFPLVVAIFLTTQVARAQILDHAAPPAQVAAVSR